GGNDGAPVINNDLTAVAPPGTLPLISADWNIFTTVPASGGAQIPPVNVGADFIVWNFGISNLLVTPQPTYQIDALSAGSPYSLAPNKMQWFRCTAPNQLLSTQLG